MNFKTLLLVVVLFLLALPIVYSVPPIREIFTGTTGLVIEHPEFIDVPVSSDLFFVFHVFNLTQGTPVLDGLSCELDLHNSTGHVIFSNLEVPKVGNHFEETIAGSNISHEGYYEWVVLCNTSTEGGFVGETFEVTRNGFERVELNDLGFGIIASILAIIIIYFVILIRMFTERSFSEHGLVRMLFYLVSFWVILIPINLMSIFNEYYNGPVTVTTMIETLYQIVIWLNYFITIYFILWFVVQMIRKIGEGRRLKNMGE
jgi:hypothetical protein